MRGQTTASPLGTAGLRTDRFPLIRSSRIFTAAVRDVLEAGLLREICDDGLTPRQLELLAFISLAEHHIDEVADFLGVTPPSATKAVDKLEQQGLVLRSGTNADRRLTLLSCSEKGKHLLDSWLSIGASRLASVLEDFTDAEIADLTRLLERFALALIAFDPRPERPCLRCSGYFDADCPVRFIHDHCSYQQREKR